jgi:outer membrane protein TolC
MNHYVRRRAWRSSAILAGTAALVLAGCTLTPKPLTNEERAVEAVSDLNEVYSEQEPLHGALTLNQAFARALKYNLDKRAKLYEEAIAQDDLNLSAIDMLPKAAVNGSYTTRNNVDASSSVSVISGATTVPPSTSSDINRHAADLNVSWNVLDFGVSYFTARQQADRTLIAQEQKRRVEQQLLQDVRRAFWRAASAQRLSKDVRESIRAAESALPEARKVETEALRSPIDALRYQKLLLDLLRQLESVERLLATSKTELAQLVNLPLDQNFSVATGGGMRMEGVHLPIRQMEEIALMLNPDIRQTSYEHRISVDESRKALLKLLPGVTFSYDPNYDSNSFTYNNHWVAGAVRVNGYLNSLIQAPFTIRRADNAEELAITKRKAVSIATLAKLHIAYEQYLTAAREYRWSDQLAGVDERLYQQIANRASSDVQSELERISAKVSAVNSELRRYQSYADAQAALGRVYATMGLDALADKEDTLDVASLARAIQKSMREWRKIHPQTLLSSAEPAKPQ